jgi:hypothetical protein
LLSIGTTGICAVREMRITVDGYQKKMPYLFNVNTGRTAMPIPRHFFGQFSDDNRLMAAER